MINSHVRDITIGGGDVTKVVIGEQQPLTLIGGPCAIESLEHALSMAERIKAITDKLGIQYIYKSCYDKDCRSSDKSYLGIGGERGLEILSAVREKYKIPVDCDISNVAWMEQTAKVVDFIQIPAYLSRQTHLLIAAGKTGKAIHIKKGQFMSPWNMKNAALKVASNGNHNILLTDRGTFFGYNMLVNDMRCFKIMKESGYPVGFDATHSVQWPGSMGTFTGGEREHIPALVRAAMAAGANALFMEIHDKPDHALCDAPTQIPLHRIEGVLTQAKAIYDIVREMPELEVENYVHPMPERRVNP